MPLAPYFTSAVAIRQLYRDIEWYFPAPTEEEVLVLKALAFPTLRDEDVHMRMRLWGPNPRLPGSPHEFRSETSTGIREPIIESDGRKGKGSVASNNNTRWYGYMPLSSDSPLPRGNCTFWFNARGR
jgi:hypothetical protein